MSPSVRPTAARCPRVSSCHAPTDPETPRALLLKDNLNQLSPALPPSLLSLGSEQPTSHPIFVSPQTTQEREAAAAAAEEGS